MATRKKSKSTRAKAARKPAARRSKPAARRSKPAAKKSGDTGGLTSLAPSLTVNEIDKTLDWYTNTLGFKITRRWERENRLVGAEVKAGDVTIYLSQEDGAKGERVKGIGFRLYRYTKQNIDKLAAGIKARGGTLASEPADVYGARSFNLEDPTGYKITVSS